MISQRSKRNQVVDSSVVLVATCLSVFQNKAFQQVCRSVCLQGTGTLQKRVREAPSMQSSSAKGHVTPDWNNFEIKDWLQQIFWQIFVSEQVHLKASLTFHRLKWDWAHRLRSQTSCHPYSECKLCFHICSNALAAVRAVQTANRYTAQEKGIIHIQVNQSKKIVSFLISGTGSRTEVTALEQ